MSHISPVTFIGFKIPLEKTKGFLVREMLARKSQLVEGKVSLVGWNSQVHEKKKYPPA
ncbi:hypothetical protein VIBNISOn1_1820001 [Vibrio nigripulchritudo SOn1]|uniref:Uncharacterized protein n=1 Tax=Vibrio nigripulchritudo SOn1 TaxID=1238450 RepID=A0AAV2VPI9_9VIBR|nr:hypothetical protein VIBNISOn1_1820001 [Vibrio nigripulchritudo SOn1]